MSFPLVGNHQSGKVHFCLWITDSPPQVESMLVKVGSTLIGVVFNIWIDFEQEMGSQFPVCYILFLKVLHFSTNVQVCKLACSWKLLILTPSLANGHITLNTPVLVRSLKLSNVEPSQYLDGWPPGNTGCCWHSTFSSALRWANVCKHFPRFSKATRGGTGSSGWPKCSCAK